MHSLLGKAAHFSILEMLEFISRLDRSGELVVEQGDQIARILLSKGHLVRGWRTGGTPIGEVLQKRGLLDRQALQRILQIQRTQARRPPLGKLLLDNGMIDPKALEDALAEQIKDALNAILKWDHAVFSFDQRELTLADSFAVATEINIQTQKIIFEVISDQNKRHRGR